MNIKNSVNNVISIDIGATSGRVMKVSFNDGKLLYTELYRFKNKLINENNRLVWDINYLIDQIKIALRQVNEIFSSLSISTWGCDFCLIDKNGILIRNPICYRDDKYQNFKSSIDYSEIYQRTGIQKLPFNTIFQLEYLRKYEKDIYDKTAKILMIPDYIAYVLTNNMYLEETNASTTACYDLDNHQMDRYLLEKIDFSIEKFPQLIKPTESYGKITKQLSDELQIPQIDVIACCSHDTASAIVGSVSDYNSVYISSGTWSLMGTLEKEKNVTEESFNENFTNEIGYKESIRYLKNIMGMWILEEYRRELESQNIDNSFETIVKELKEDTENISYIDPDCELFSGVGIMSTRIKDYCQKTNQIVPSSRNDIVKTIYYSLVFKYRYIYEKLKKLINKDINYINIVGGGSKNLFLSTLVSNVLNIKVLTGPIEATVIGNACMQFISNKTINESDLKEIIRNTEEILEINPNSNLNLNLEYEKFKKIMEVRDGRC